MFKSKKVQILLSVGLIISILINALCIREIIKYEPSQYKRRFWGELHINRLVNKKLDLSELKSDSCFTILALGQSNAANYSCYYYQPIHDVLNYCNGTLYKAKEPLIGATGNGGSVWTLVADKLVESGLCKKVIIIPIAVASTDVEYWANGEGNTKLKATLDDLRQHHINLTHIFWHQGENNNGSSKENYKKQLGIVLKTIRDGGQQAPFYCSIATYSSSATDKPEGLDTSIQNAQKEFVTENKNVFTGPNTDDLIYAIDRFDAQHFSKYGLYRYADLWFDAVKKSTK